MTYNKMTFLYPPWLTDWHTMAIIKFEPDRPAVCLSQFVRNVMNTTPVHIATWKHSLNIALMSYLLCGTNVVEKLKFPLIFIEASHLLPLAMRTAIGLYWHPHKIRSQPQATFLEHTFKRAALKHRTIFGTCCFTTLWLVFLYRNKHKGHFPTVPISRYQWLESRYVSAS